MRNTCAILGLSVILIFSTGCSSRPISKTWHHLKKGYNTTKQVVRTTKAVAEVLNPLEYVYINEQGEAIGLDGQPFITEDAILQDTPIAE